MKKIWLIYITILIVLSPLRSQQWIPDTLFGNNAGLQVSNPGSKYLYNLASQPDGKIIAGGYLNYAGSDYNALVRFDECGLIDSSFGIDGFVQHQFMLRNKAYHTSLQQDGKILCTGVQASSNALSVQIPFIARYTSNGSPDTQFANNGSQSVRFDNVSSGSFYTVKEIQGGRILGMGISSSNGNGGYHGLGVMRFKQNGSLDSTFGVAGKARTIINTYYFPARGGVLSNGQIIVAGRYYDNGLVRFAATCFDSTGNVVTSFANSGVFTDTVNLKGIYSDAYLAIQTDNKVVLAATREPESSGIELIRFSATGVLDPSFGAGGHANINIPNVTCTGLKLLANNKILIFGSKNDVNTGCAIRLNSSGDIDSSFGNDGLMIFQIATSGSQYLTDLLEMQGDRLLAGCSNYDFYFKRYCILSNVPHISGNSSLIQSSGAGSFQWYMNGTVIPGANQSQYIPLSDGYYQVELTDLLGCSMISDLFQVLGTGISESALHKIRSGMNPVYGFIKLDYFNVFSNELKYGLIDMMGRQLLDGSLPLESAGQLVINVEEIPNGFYSLWLRFGDESKVIKLIVLNR